MTPTQTGLTAIEAERRLRELGPNALPAIKARSLVAVFLRQFLSPLVYILLAAALVSAALSDLQDALFIGIVLLINGIIGTVQEYSAERAVVALRSLEQPRATVVRDGVQVEIDSRQIVPGDLVLLTAGGMVPADLRLVTTQDLRCDESVLTGESRAVAKSQADDGKQGVAFAGTVVTRGRASGEVIATGSATQIGKIARMIAGPAMSKPPLVVRLERFSRMIAVAVGVSVAVLVVAGFLRGLGVHELFLMAVGLAVSAIPEGLPVAISVALAIGMRRMAKSNVIVRNMPAIEALGSCTMIATDKTGTLTMNELAVTEVALPDGTSVTLEQGRSPADAVFRSPLLSADEALFRTGRLLRAAALPNEGRLVQEDDGWVGTGDTVDVALLAAARSGGVLQEDISADHPLLERIPYEPELKYAASFHHGGDRIRIFVKGAPETLIAMADRMDAGPEEAIDRSRLLAQKEEMTARGLRVLAFAEGSISTESEAPYGHDHLINLVFLGLAGMQDPIRPEVPAAIAACRRAGIEVAMITGDDPKTAAAIAAQAGIQFGPSQVVTGDEVMEITAEGKPALDRLTREARIYARVEPGQKLDIVMSMARNGHFIAVTGDGVNDAPALKHAHVGVAMGKKGTDVAKESADIIIADDNFASLVQGIKEGRVSYANIRKVVFMLVSTGAAEVVLFLLAVPFGFAMPLLPAQLLWLNLVTNGIQDVTLAAEKAEGDELAYPPRKPSESIFDRVMIRRILVSTLVMGCGGFLVYWWLLRNGRSESEARNLLLLLFVLFENFQTFNSRSERHSVFRRIFANPLLVAGVLAAQGLHIAAMHIEAVSGTLEIAPVSIAEWATLLAIASILLLAMELDKGWEAWRRSRAAV